MDCRPRMKTERDAQPPAHKSPIEWLNSAPSVGSPSTFKSFVAMSSASSGDSPADTAHLQQRLIHILLTQETLQEGLLCLAETLGEALAVDCCLILPQFKKIAPSDPLYGYFAPSFRASAQLATIFKQPIVQTFLATAAPLIIEDLQATGKRSHSTRQKSSKSAGSLPPLPPHVRALLAVNTQFQGQINGTIILIRSQPYDWQEAEVQQLQVLSPHIAIALSQAQLEQQVQQQVRYQNLINQLTAAIRNSWELDRVFQLAVEGAASALQVSRGLVFMLKYTDPLRKSRSGRARAKANVVAEWVGQPLDNLENTDNTNPENTRLNLENWNDQTFWASDCPLFQQVLTSSEPLALSAYRPPADTRSEWSEALPSALFCLDRFPALLLIPLENQGTILGCLALQNHQPRNWTPEEISFVKLVAAQLSTAIIQVRTLQHVQTLVQERTAQLQRSLDVQAKLYEKTRQQVEQLRRLHEEREEFLSTISHELRTPLTSMTLAIRMLRQADLSPERRIKYLDILEQQCVQETQLINDLLALRQLETSTTTAQLQRLDVRYLIRDIAQSIAENFAEQDLNLTLNLPTKPLTLYTESDSLSRILTELLTNARKYSNAGTVVQLGAYADPTSQTDQVIITLQNVGAGILPDELPHIFDKFRRGQGVTQQAIQGTGLGLALVKRLVEHLGGTIEASSHPLEHSTSWQTCFVVRLPQQPEEMIHPIS
jgi:signal transduction histidine kinase